MSQSIYQIGVIDKFVLGEVLAKIAGKFLTEMEEKYSLYVHIFDWAVSVYKSPY